MIGNMTLIRQLPLGFASIGHDLKEKVRPRQASISSRAIKTRHRKSQENEPTTTSRSDIVQPVRIRVTAKE